MRARALIVAIVATVLAGLCVRMSVWQLTRWQEKHRANVLMRAALAAPPVTLRDGAAPLTALAARRVRAEGVYDERVHVLVSDRWNGDRPGVEVATPLRLSGGGALWVDRGWLPSPDGIAARVPSDAEPGPRIVTGLIERASRGAGGRAWTRLPGDSVVIWCARALNADSLRAHVPAVANEWVLRALPDSGAPALPERHAPEPADEGMHASYALQWLLFAIALGAGAVLVIVRERAASASAVAPAAR